MALLLALSANIGVATMVGSFRTTFTGWLDQRLASELYVFTADTAEAARLAAFLDGRADALLPILSAEARPSSLPAEVFGIVDHATYREAWPLLSGVGDPWGALYAGAGVLVNEQMARRHDLSLGDPVPLSPTSRCRWPGSIPTTATPPGRRSWRWRSSATSTPGAGHEFRHPCPAADAPALAGSCGRSSACPKPPSATRRRSRPSRWRSSRTPSA
jgi:hypothetical protein